MLLVPVIANKLCLPRIVQPVIRLGSRTSGVAEKLLKFPLANPFRTLQ